MRTKILVLLACVSILSGCADMSSATKGGAGGAAAGALVGQAIGHNTAGTLIGAAVGGGLGYIVGNEMDKSKQQQQQYANQAPPPPPQYTPQPQYPPPQQQDPLINSSWQVLSMSPRPQQSYQTMILRFNADGTVTTTTTYSNGAVQTATERYNMSGPNLTIYHDKYTTSSSYRIEGNRLYMYSNQYNIVMQRIG